MPSYGSDSLECPKRARSMRVIALISTYDKTKSLHTNASDEAISERVGRFPERRGLLERDAESTCLSGLALGGEPIEDLLAHSHTYRISVGPQAGRKLLTLGTLAQRSRTTYAPKGGCDSRSPAAIRDHRADSRGARHRARLVSTAHRPHRPSTPRLSFVYMISFLAAPSIALTSGMRSSKRSSQPRSLRPSTLVVAQPGM